MMKTATEIINSKIDFDKGIDYFYPSEIEPMMELYANQYKQELEKVKDWNKYIPALTNVPNKEGIERSWLWLWEEIEKWYGDIKKKETGEEFLKRMQSTFSLKSISEEQQLRQLSQELLEALKYAKSLVPSNRSPLIAGAIQKAEVQLKQQKT